MSAGTSATTSARIARSKRCIRVSAAYNCRTIEGTTSWSVHAFGAAIDTNWQRNPRGNSTWNGIGSDGVNYRRYLPNLWKGAYPGHNFYWGLNFSTTPDPMHFQYVTGY